MSWHVLDINPEPWAIGPLSIGRRGGKLFASVGRNQQLAAYQEAVRAALGEQTAITGQVRLTLYVWRQQAIYTGATKRIRRNHADSTNMQKSTEDALQGVFYDNDSVVADVRTVMVAQGPDVTPRVVIHVEAWHGLDPSEIPSDVWSVIDRDASLFDVEPDNAWTASDDIF